MFASVVIALVLVTGAVLIPSPDVVSPVLVIPLELVIWLALIISLVSLIPIPLVTSEFVVITPSPELPAPAVTVGVQFLSNTMIVVSRSGPLVLAVAGGDFCNPQKSRMHQCKLCIEPSKASRQK